MWLTAQNKKEFFVTPAKSKKSVFSLLSIEGIS